MTTRAVRRLLAALVIGTIGAAGLVVMSTAVGAQAADSACQRTVSSGAVDLAIPDLGSRESMIDVPEDGLVVTDVDVAMDIHHTFDADLTVSLQSQTDTGVFRGRATLFDRSGTRSANILGTILDDSAPLPISWGEAPFTGRFLPTTPLSRVAGAAGGRWFLVAEDNVEGDTGTLDDWSLTFTYASCDFDEDGVEDHIDSCRTIAAATSSGCPTAARHLTSAYAHGAFRGVLSSTVGACEARRAVTVFRVLIGPDARIGTVATRSDGTYRLARARHHGRYYAVSRLAVVHDVAQCPAVTSSAFRIH